MRNAHLFISRIGYIICFLLVAALWMGTAGAQVVNTISNLQVTESGGEITVEFTGLGKCKYKTRGKTVYGCLYVSGDSNQIHFFLQGSSGWEFKEIEIREEYADWGDSVPSFILNDIKDKQGAGAVNFFPDNTGVKNLSGNSNKRHFTLWDLNGQKFTIQYRIKITNGSVDSNWIHPAWENEG